MTSDRMITDTVGDVNPATEDVRELLGMRTAAARVLVTAYLGALAYAGWFACPAGAGWTMAATWLLVAACTVQMLRVPGDPLPLRHTVFTTAACTVAVNLLLSVADVPFDGYLQLWPLPATAAILAFLCARGRTGWAWAGLGAVVASCTLWAVGTGQGAIAGLAVALTSLGPLLMATFFAWTIRPAVHQIFALRRQTTLRAAADAADDAIADERDHQLARLDDLARPMLERIATRRPLSEPENTACRLLEAHLRDTLRAPVLAVPGIVEAARRARTLGVDVILLDDHGLDDADDAVLGRVVATVTETLSRIETGTVTVRVLPPHRPIVATVLHTGDDEHTTRVELAPDGSPVPHQVTDGRRARFR